MKGNGLGPENKGPKTGRGLGFCYGWGKSGYLNDKVAGENNRLKNGYGYKNRWDLSSEKKKIE
ncbi:MAG: DUF5320 domain-containing protein [Spirochaetaceae bacterium]|nr:DUF5320 domain-containing protein [Spirochaetaceae bacterium]